MDRLIAWVRCFVRELRRRRVIRVAVVYGTTAFVVLQLAGILADPLGLGNWAIRLVTFLLTLGFPLAVGLAWVYNLTEEGVVRAGGEAEGALGPGGKPLTSNWLIVGLLAVAIGLLLYPRVFSSGGNPSGQASRQGTPADTAQVKERSIAVLPFSNLSGQKETRPLTRGLHDDLLTRLSNVSDLTVISRTSVERYRDTDLPLPAIADSLGVRWIVEGGVQKAGGRIQVNAQLISPRTDAHRWAESYERDLSAKNLFAIQGEIAGEIAEALKATLTPGEQKRLAGAPTENLKAYRLYVKGRSALNTRSPEGVASAVKYFQRAVQADSSYALAWSGLADAARLFPGYGPDSLDAPDISSEEAARRALKLDPELAEAHSSMGYVYLDQERGPSALRHLRRAVELKPSYAQAHHWLGLLYLSLGRVEAARKHTSLAVELNAQHFAARGVRVFVALAEGDVSEARTHQQRVKRVRESASTKFTEGLVLYHERRWDDLERVSERLLSSGSEYIRNQARFYLARIAATRRDTSRVRQILEKIREKMPEEVPGLSGFVRVLLGLVHAVLGEEDAAFSVWNKVESWPRPYVFRYYFSDVLAPLRRDPRYEKLIHEINEYWGLNPDGSIPDSVGVSLPSNPEADA